jgi:hypothetical protein
MPSVSGGKGGFEVKRTRDLVMSISSVLLSTVKFDELSKGANVT